MKVLFDTNVVVDVLLARAPHAAASAAVLGLAETGRLTAVMAASSLTTVHYLVRKAAGSRAARRHLETLLSICEVAPVDEPVRRQALTLGFTDYEDAVLHEAARSARCRGIVTRDAAGFRKAALPTWTPEELLAALCT